MRLQVSASCLLSWLAPLAVVMGCGKPAPEATVEGTLRVARKPLDNCLVTFLPMAAEGHSAPHSSGVTNGAGHFELRLADQRPGAAVGPHCVVVQDLSVSNGVPRVDHGTADVERPPAPPGPARRSRVPPKYSAAASSPLQQNLRPGHQVIELELVP